MTKGLGDPGHQRMWYRVSPRTAVVVAVALYLLVTLFHWYDDFSGQAIVVLYVLPVALLAVTFGTRGGLVAAAIGFGLFAALEGVHSSGDIDVTGWVVRAVAMFLLGGLLGHATDRTVASQRAALAEERRRCEVEGINRRYAQAMEISDSLVQKMAAAKWLAEQSRTDDVVEVLAATIVEAEGMAAGLLGQRMSAPLVDDRAPRPLLHGESPQAPPEGVGPNYRAVDVSGRIEVLVVDNDPDVAESTAGVLRSAGIEVRVALSATDALALCGSSHFHVVVLDHRLGDVTCDVILERLPDLPPAVVVSAADAGEVEQLHHRHGDRVFAVRTKPCDPPDLIEAVQAAAAGPRG